MNKTDVHNFGVRPRDLLLIRFWLPLARRGRGGGGASRPKIREGAVSKKFFRPFAPQFGRKLWGEGAGLSWIRHWNQCVTLHGISGNKVNARARVSWHQKPNKDVTFKLYTSQQTVSCSSWLLQEWYNMDLKDKPLASIIIHRLC